MAGFGRLSPGGAISKEDSIMADFTRREVLAVGSSLLMSAAMAHAAASNIDDPQNFNHRFATANGIRMHYVEEGQGPLVLLLHGYP